MLFALLCSVALPLHAAALNDADAVYCLTVYAEAKELAGDDPATTLMANDAKRRWPLLAQRESDLLNDDPTRHAAARTIAKRRFAALPTGAAHAGALRESYEACRRQEDGTVLVAGASNSPLSDADAFYCLSVYAEVKDFATAGEEEAAVVGMDAETRWLPLSEREADLLNDDPTRHAAASRAAKRRFSALPKTPAAARNVALHGAYEECRRLEDVGTPVDTARAQLLADRRFCRELMGRATTIGPRMRSLFNPDELATLDETRRIAKALARPLPGRAMSAAEDGEANRLLGERRKAFNLAVANWTGEDDPMVQELSKCHEDYRLGLLGGPNVLEEGPGVAAAADVVVPGVAADPGKAGAVAAGGALPAVAEKAQPGPRVDLGAVFRMRETMPGGNYEGIWRRRGDSDIYDGLWVHASTGNVTYDVLEVRGVEDGELVIARLGLQGSYRAKLHADGSLGPGRASWMKSAKYSWRPLPAQGPRGVKLGAVLHMREVTFEGDYEGIWRRRPGRGNVYDALWVHAPTGELSSDILIITGVYRGRLVIQRYNAKGEYSAPLAKDGRLGPGTASWASDAGYHWLVVPAQKVRVLPADTRVDAAEAALQP
jgi:hypothetical protein